MVDGGGFVVVADDGDEAEDTKKLFLGTAIEDDALPGWSLELPKKVVGEEEEEEDEVEVEEVDLARSQNALNEQQLQSTSSTISLSKYRSKQASKLILDTSGGRDSEMDVKQLCRKLFLFLHTKHSIWL